MDEVRPYSQSLAQRDGLVERLEGGDGQHRAEDLLLHDVGLLAAVGEHRGLVEVAGMALVGFAAAFELGAVVQRLLHGRVAPVPAAAC